MTIPSRPAPAPPGSSAQFAAAGANATLEQLRLQLQEQHQLQQQHGGVQRMTIKLPPPPRGPNSSSTALPLQKRNTNIPLDSSNSSSSSSITRKFPPARYSPATNWDDSPFDAFSNGSSKKIPPPRPPPPKLNGKKQTAPAPPASGSHQSHNIISNIFHRKKQAKAQVPKRASNGLSAEQRVYGLSTRGTNYTNTNSITNSSATTTTNYSNRIAMSSTTDWNAVWNSTASTTTSSYSTTTAQPSNGEAQLISFDSPPSSPTFTQKSNSDCVSVDSFSSDSNFSSPHNGNVSQPESGFEDDFGAHGSNVSRSRPMTASPRDPWGAFDAFGSIDINNTTANASTGMCIGTAPVRNLSGLSSRQQQSQGASDNPLCNGKSLLPPPPSLSMPTIIKPKGSQKPKAPKPPLLPKPSGLSNMNLLDSDLPTPPSPPMPKGAPPALPASLLAEASTAPQQSAGVSILDVISGKVDALALNRGSSGYVQDEEKPYGIALYDFDGLEEGDLSFRENEKIFLLEKVSEEWYRGRTRSGCEGIFPGNYIDIRVPLKDPITSAPTITIPTTTTYETSEQQSENYYAEISYQSLPRIRCLYDFPADVAGDLELKENDYVTIHYRINEDWLFGECNAKQGQFPANFLEYIPDNIPYMP